MDPWNRNRSRETQYTVERPAQPRSYDRTPDPQWVRQTVERNTNRMQAQMPNRQAPTTSRPATPGGPVATNGTVHGEQNGTGARVELQETANLTLDPEWFLRRNAEWVEFVEESGSEERIFPDSQPAGIYPRDLVGTAFVITSDFRWGMSPANGKFEAREQAQCMLRFFYPQDSMFSKPRMATLNGTYLLNQIRSIPLDILIGGMLWTVAPNPFMDDLPGNKGQKPRMLKVWEYADQTNQDETPFDVDYYTPDGVAVVDGIPQTAPVRPAQPQQPQQPPQRGRSRTRPQEPVEQPAEQPVRRGPGRPRKNP